MIRSAQIKIPSNFMHYYNEAVKKKREFKQKNIDIPIFNLLIDEINKKKPPRTTDFEVFRL